MNGEITTPQGWSTVPLWSISRRTDRTGRPDAELLSVYRDHGVVPKSSRGDNFNKPSDDLSTYRYVEPGDLVLNKMKTWQGSLAVSDHAGIVSPAYYVCSLSPSVEPRFVHFLLRSSPYVAMYGARSKGIRPNQWDLPYDEFRTVPVLLPPLEVQQRIADFLNDQVARIDRAIQLRQRQIELLPGRTRASISWTLASSRSSTGAERVPLSAIARIVDTEHKTAPSSDSGPFRSVGTGAIRSGRVLHDLAKPIDDRAYREWTRRATPQPGDLLLTREAPVGQVALLRDQDSGLAIGQRVVLLKPDLSCVSGAFLLAFFLGDGFQRDLEDLTQGSLHPHLNMSSIRRLRIPLAPSEDQVEVSAECDRILSEAERLAKHLQESLLLIHERNRSLITAAVTGEFDVSSASSRAADVVITGEGV